jgi:replicative DNA helicase
MLDNLSDPVAEEKAVAAALASPRWAAKIDHTQIIDKQLRWAANSIASLCAAGQKITPYSLASMMGDPSQEAVLEALLARHGDIDAPVAFATVRDMKLRRDCAGASRRSYDEALDLDRDIAGTIARAEGSMVIVSTSLAGGGGSGVRRGGDFKAVRENFDWRVANPGRIRGMSMGFPDLEQMLDGFHRKKSYLVGARPAVGKSALGKDFTEHFLTSGRRVLTFTLEMGADEYRERLVSSVSEVPISSLRSMPYTQLEIDAVHAALGRLAFADWHIDDTPGLTVDDLRRKVRAVNRDAQIDLVVIDYIQLMRGSESRSQKDRRLEVGEISAAIKQLAKDMDVPIVSLAQLKRPSTEVYDRDTRQYSYPSPKLSDLKESGDLEQDADVVILIDREAEPKLIVAKNRGGPTGDIPVYWIPELTKFKE